MTKRSIVISVILSAVVYGCSATGADFATRLKNGTRLLESGQNSEAAAELREAVRLNPSNATGRITLSMALERLPGALNRADAIRELRAAVELDPKDLSARLKLAELYNSVRAHEKAREQALAVMIGEPASSRAKLALALSFAGTRDFDTALEFIRSAGDDNPESASVKKAASSVSLMKGDRASAIRYLEDALRLKEGDIEAGVSLSFLYREAGELAKAEGVLKKNLSAYPDNPSLLKALGDVYAAARRDEEAVAAYRRIVSANPSLSQGYLLLADFFYSAGRINDSIETLKAGAQRVPGSMALKNRLAEALLDAGKTDEASALVESLSALASGDYKVLYLKGRLRLNAGDLRQAERELADAVKDEPRFPEARYYLGLVYQLRGKLEQASTELDRAVKLRPAEPGYRSALAYVHLISNRPGQALDEALTVTSVRPGDLAARLIAADACLAMKKPKEALAHFAKASASAPDDFRPLLGAAKARMQMNDRAGAFSNLEKALKLAPGRPEIVESAAMLLIRGGGPRAVEWIKTEISRFPDSHANYRLLGRAYAALRKEALAEDAYKKAVSMSPGDIASRMELADFYDSRGSHEDAIRVLEGGLSKGRPSPDIYIRIGGILQSTGRVEEAVESYKRALLEAPENSIAANNLAWLYSEKGEFDKALPLAEAAMKSSPGNPVISDTLGWIYYRMNLNTMAQPYLITAAERLKNDPEVRYHLGMSYYKRGNLTEAGKELSASLEPGVKAVWTAEARAALEEIEKKAREAKTVSARASASPAYPLSKWYRN